MATTTSKTSDRQDAYRDILITAIEGGINYWAYVNDYEPDCDAPDYKAGANCHAVISVRYAEDFPEVQKVRVTEATIRKGFNILRNGGGHHVKPAPEWYHRKWRDAYRKCATGEWDYDAGDADSILQAGLFGEVVYG